MSTCIPQPLVFEENQSLFNNFQFNPQGIQFLSPIHKKKRLVHIPHEDNKPCVSTDLRLQFEEMTHKNGSSKHRLEDEDFNFNYFAENYDRLVCDRSSSSSNNQSVNTRPVNIVSPSPTNILLSPKKKTNRKISTTETSSTNNVDYESADKDLLKVCRLLFHSASPHSKNFAVEDSSIMMKYQVVGAIDQGSFSTVLKVKERQRPDTEYALKKFKAPFKSFNERTMMLNEVLMMSRPFVFCGGKPCPHVVKCYLAWQEDSTIHMLMELSSNGSLKDLIDKCSAEGVRIPDKSLWKIAHDVSAGLHCIHNSGVVHLDIKPSNVLISSDGTLKIGDFGLSIESGSTNFDRDGDCRYMANELLNESIRLPSADMYSLGLTLYELSLLQDSQIPQLEVPKDGPEWHALRQLHFANPTGRTAAFMRMLHSTMSPVPEQRMTAQDILKLVEVEPVKSWRDPLLLSCRPGRAINYTLAMNRSPSFVALNMG